MHNGIKTRETGPQRAKAWPHGAPFVFGVLTSFFAFNLLAPRRPGGRHPWIVDRLGSDIGLDPGQKAEVVRIFAEARAQYAAAPEGGRQSGHDPRLGEIRRATRARVRALLRPEQEEAFDLWIQELNARRGGGAPLRDSGGADAARRHTAGG